MKTLLLIVVFYRVDGFVFTVSIRRQRNVKLPVEPDLTHRGHAEPITVQQAIQLHRTKRNARIKVRLLAAEVKFNGQNEPNLLVASQFYRYRQQAAMFALRDSDFLGGPHKVIRLKVI